MCACVSLSQIPQVLVNQDLNTPTHPISISSTHCVPQEDSRSEWQGKVSFTAARIRRQTPHICGGQLLHGTVCTGGGPKNLSFAQMASAATADILGATLTQSDTHSSTYFRESLQKWTTSNKSRRDKSAFFPCRKLAARNLSRMLP